MARNHLVNVLIPCAAAAGDEEQGGLEDHASSSSVMTTRDEEEGTAGNAATTSSTIRSSLLQAYIKIPISMTTTWRWLRQLVFITTQGRSLFL